MKITSTFINLSILIMFTFSLLDARTFLKIPEHILTKKIHACMKKHESFSGALLIAYKGTIIFNKGYAFANLEHSIPNTPQTKFRIASITKTFTALAIMQLQERGLLNVQDHVNKYIQNYPDGDKITIHQLLTHTSGIPNYQSVAPEKFYACRTIEEIMSYMMTWPLEFKPGSQYRYSNTGYILLTAIIEKVSGKTYESFLYENIFKPLGMNNSGYDHQEIIVKNRAAGYIKDQDSIKNIPYYVNNTQIPQGSGCLYSSVEDLYLWDQALYTKKIAHTQTINSLFEPYINMSGSSQRSHGYGWFIDKVHGRRVIEYSGSLRGFTSKIMRFTDDNTTIIIVSNVEDIEDFCSICDELASLVLLKDN